MKKKIFIIFVIILINILICNFNAVKADSGLTSVITGGDDFINAGKGDNTTSIDYGKLQNTSNEIYNILLTCAVIVAVIISAILGIKFMLGSMEEKAQIKEKLIPYVIGCVIIFGAFGIWKIVLTVLQSFQ